MRPKRNERKPQMKWSTKRRDKLEDDLGIIIGELCRKWGFCNRLSGAELIRKYPLLTGDEFAAAILMAESGFDSGFETHWHGQIKSIFEWRYGKEVSQAGYAPTPL